MFHFCSKTVYCTPSAKMVAKVCGTTASYKEEEKGEVRPLVFIALLLLQKTDFRKFYGGLLFVVLAFAPPSCPFPILQNWKYS